MEESDVEKLPDDHQSPWVWQSALRLNGTPFWGLFASYWGGGKRLNFVLYSYKMLETWYEQNLAKLVNVLDVHE